MAQMKIGKTGVANTFNLEIAFGSVIRIVGSRNNGREARYVNVVGPNGPIKQSLVTHGTKGNHFELELSPGESSILIAQLADKLAELATMNKTEEI